MRHATILLLIALGAVLAAPNAAGQEIVSAAKRGDFEAVRAILESDPTQVEHHDGNDSSALHFACAGGHTNIVDLLLDRGADPNDSDDIGRTPLHAAASRGLLPVIRTMLARNADPSLLDRGGMKPVDIARHRGHLSAARLLLVADRSASWYADGIRRPAVVTLPIFSAVPKTSRR